MNITNIVLRKETNRLLNKIKSLTLFTDNMFEFADLVRVMESDNSPMAKNPKSSAKGYYQFTDDSLITAFNRLDRYFKLERKHIFELNLDEQTALFFANLFQQKGTDEFLIKIGNELDVKAMKDLYAKYHHTNPDEATLKRMEVVFNV